MKLPSKAQLTHPKYRPDIDGLRAIAVLAVIGFHAFPGWIKGGFIGVDVFFVISGFLISTILLSSLETDRFSFLNFYAHRIRRIFPALALVMLTSLSFGWFVLLPNEYAELGKQVVAGSAFAANILFWRQSGYFDVTAELKPLLHLWSLGVEEQFYIVWPVLLWFAWKKRFNLLSIIVVITLTSFIYSLSATKTNPVAAFYSPTSRTWELLLGALLAYWNLHKPGWLHQTRLRADAVLGRIIYTHPPAVNGSTLRDIKAMLGFTLITLGVFVISQERHFPGGWASLPTLGTCLIIAAGPSAWLNRKVLSQKLLVWIGLISYPLYLWHWPLLSFARIIEGGTPSKDIRIAAVLFAIVLSWITYKTIEKPIRFGAHARVKTFILIVVMLLIFGTGFAIYKGYILEETLLQGKFELIAKSIRVTSRQSECFEIPYAYKKEGAWFCNLGNRSSPTKYFAYGDSHALSLVPALEEYSAEHHINIEFTGTSGCPPLLGIQSMRGTEGIEKYNCQELNERVFKHIQKQGIQNVILIARWTYYTGSESKPGEFNPISKNPNSAINKETSSQDFAWALSNTISRYSSIGVNVVLVEDNPQQLFDPKDVLRKMLLNRTQDQQSVSADEHRRNQAHVNVLIRDQNAKAVNFDDILCDTEFCPVFVGEKSMYSDDDHLSVSGAMLIYPRLKSVLNGFN